MGKTLTEAELKEYRLRKNGQKKNYRIWWRTKQKLKEILGFFKEKEEIERLLK